MTTPGSVAHDGVAPSHDEDSIEVQLSLATSELLSVTRTQPLPPSPLLSPPSRPPAATRRASPSLGELLGAKAQHARLTPILDDTAAVASRASTAGSGGKSAVSAQETGGEHHAEEDEEEDDHLPAARLSTLIGSVKAGAAHDAFKSDEIGVEAASSDWWHDEHEPPPEPRSHDGRLSPPTPSSSPHARASGVTLPSSALDDGPWLDSRGQRIVKGRVVGRMTLARPRPRHGPASLEPASGEASTVTSPRLGTPGSSQDLEASRPQSSLGYQSPLSLAWMPTTPSRTSTPPAFFLEHFPDGPPRRASPAPPPAPDLSDAVDEPSPRLTTTNVEARPSGLPVSADDATGADRAKASSPRRSADEDDNLEAAAPSSVQASLTRYALSDSEPGKGPISHSAPASRARASVPSAANPVRSPASMLLRGAPQATTGVQQTTATLTLYGNRRAERVATLDRGDQVARPGGLGPDERIRGSTHEAPSSPPSDVRAPSPPPDFFARAAGLFSASLVPTKEEVLGTNVSSKPSRIRTRTPADGGVMDEVQARNGQAAALDSDARRAGEDGAEVEGADEDDDDGDDGGSLLSLPVSTHTNSSASASVGSPRRSARGAAAGRLRRTSSSSLGRPLPARRRSVGSASLNSAGSSSLRSDEGADDDDDDDDDDAGDASTAEAGRPAATNHGSARPKLFREVRVRGWNVVGDTRKGWVCFTVVLITDQGGTITLHRRYSSFVDLREALQAELAAPRQSGAEGGATVEEGRPLPPLPPRHAIRSLGLGLPGLGRNQLGGGGGGGVGGGLGLGAGGVGGGGGGGRFDVRHLEKRRLALQAWLEHVVIHRRLGATETVRRWIVDG